jgi:exodeoxyribonuclease-3
MTYNVNGIRSALDKGLASFLQTHDPTIVCLQEIKADASQIPQDLLTALGYHCFWFSAQKKGYSGTAILSKIEPKEVVYGCEHPLFDAEGRVIRADFDNFSVISAYFPSGSAGDERQAIKIQFLSYFYTYLQNLAQSRPQLIVCGDYNICHKPIDIHDPVSNKNSSGFLPEERAWMDVFFESGFVDSFRQINAKAHQYSWWSFRAGARKRNKGWRIDYIAHSLSLTPLLTDSVLFMEDNHSDHCAVMSTYSTP